MSQTDLSIRFSRQDYYELSNKLALDYQQEPDLLRKNIIISQLYRIMLPMFKSWNVFDEDSRDDFEQEAYFWILRSVELWDSERGAYLSYMKFYVLKAWTAEAKRFTNENVYEKMDPLAYIEDDFPDYIWWTKVKGYLEPDEWWIFRLLFFEKRTLDQIADEVQINRTIIANKKKNIFNKIKTIVFKSRKSINVQKEDYFQDCWLTVDEFASKMRMSKNYVRNMTLRDSKGWIIDGKDIVREPAVRIHYRCEDGKLLFPRFRKKNSRKKIGMDNLLENPGKLQKVRDDAKARRSPH